MAALETPRGSQHSEVSYRTINDDFFIDMDLTCTLCSETSQQNNSTDDLKRPFQRKMDMRFGMWNARSLYTAGALGLVTSESTEWIW